MSTIKNFGIAGVSADLQFGKAGPRLITTGGVFSFKNAANSASVAVEVAAPTSDTHATTRLFVNNGFAATRTGAGLNTNGSYLANTSGTYVNAATSLKSADDLLDSALYAVSAKLSTALTSGGLANDGSLPAWSGTNYVTATTSLYNAVKSLDAAVKNNADAVAGIGNAFNYTGTLPGGATAPAAYDLSSLPAAGRNTGDFYKVTTSGYFKDNSTATAFYAKSGDGIVKNTTASGWDIIDNTNSTVDGTASRITVTGSSDTGFIADIASDYVGQTSITTLGTISTGVWNGTAISAAKGGTGLTTYAVGDVLYAATSSTLARLAKGTALQFIRMNAGATAPEYATLTANVVSFSSPNYSANTVAAALEEVKGQLGNLASDTIVSPDAKTSITVTDAFGIRFYDEIAATKTEFARLTGTANTATLAAQGTGSNVDIVFAPKGTGQINHSNAVLSGVANAATATDALPLGQARALFTRYLAVDITEANANVTIGAINGVVLRAIVYLTTAFQSGSSLTIGYAGSQSAVATAGEIDHSAAGVSVIDNVAVLNQTILAYISGTGAGAGKIIIEYLSF